MLAIKIYSGRKVNVNWKWPVEGGLAQVTSYLHVLRVREEQRAMPVK